MTPAARLSAAIAVLDAVLAGAPAEQTLTNWGRGHRFAGSGDRHALRDLVYDALRCKRSFAALGGAETGRGLILGGLRDRGVDPAAFFTGAGHAPAPLGPGDAGRTPKGAEALDCPDWLLPLLQEALGVDCDAVLAALRHRAPLYLRVNLAKASVAEAQRALAADAIVAEPVPLAKAALQVTENARKIQTSTAYLSGLVELQDAASQAVIAALPLCDDQKVLDYCAGGGGKTLAMAVQARLQLYAHDAHPRRMHDLGPRAKRAGASVTISENPAGAAPYDLILTDVPCSGSGSWRRDPQGKWALTPARLQALQALQAEILDAAAGLVAPTGTLAYATCSMLREENEAQIDAFLRRHRGWQCLEQRRFSPLSGADGFFLALLTRAI